MPRHFHEYPLAAIERTRSDRAMKKIAIAAVFGSMIGTAFVAGIAVGKTPPPQPKFTAVEEVKWDDVGGPKLAQLTGDYKKGPYTGLLKIPAGFTSPRHAHTGAYEAVEIQGTTSHWLKGEDGTKAKKMTPGSYWMMPAKLEHVTACAAGTDCILYLSQKLKFDMLPAKEDKKPAGSAAAGSAAAGSAAAKPPAATIAPKAPATAGSAAPAPAKK